MSRLERCIAEGAQPNKIACKDGFEVSVIAGPLLYCAPRPEYVPGMGSTYFGPYTALEVGFPSARPEPWECTEGDCDAQPCNGWAAYCEDPNDPTGTVYGYVPVQMVRDLIAVHGGEQEVSPREKRA